MLLALIPLPYRILALVLAGLALLGAGFASGYRLAENRAAAAQAKLLKSHIKTLNAERARADALALQIGQAEARIIIKTVEVIKHVPQVTTGRRCLEPAAVRLLQPAADSPRIETIGQPAAENATELAASDTDVAYWIAEANRQYETCAGRVNALVDYFAAADSAAPQ